MYEGLNHQALLLNSTPHGKGGAGTTYSLQFCLTTTFLPVLDPQSLRSPLRTRAIQALNDNMALPPPSTNQAYWNISALDAGVIYLPVGLPIQGENPSEVHAHPSLAFLLQHSTNKHIKALFDLGIRRDIHSYPTAVQHLLQSTVKVDVPQDVTESLRSGGINPNEISYVFLSHLHYDNIGNPAAFPNATFLIGNEGLRLLENGFPYNPSSPYSTTALPPDRLIFLTPDDALSWKELGPFPRANDIFKDGSMYIVDAPGHLPGHINLLARTSSRGTWVYLAGDSTHDSRTLLGNKHSDSGGNSLCIHADPSKAEEHLSRVRKLLTNVDTRTLVDVVLTHDRDWAVRNRASFFPRGQLHQQYQ